MLLALTLFLMTRAPYAAPDCGEGPTDVRTKEQLDRRYEDFYRDRHRDEARDEARNRGRGERKDLLAERSRRLELARREYVQHRRPAPDGIAAERAAEAAVKARRAQIEDARRCFVARKTKAERSGGRQIPANAEFGLDE